MLERRRTGRGLLLVWFRESVRLSKTVGEEVSFFLFYFLLLPTRLRAARIVGFVDVDVARLVSFAAAAFAPLALDFPLAASSGDVEIGADGDGDDDEAEAARATARRGGPQRESEREKEEDIDIVTGEKF